MKKVIPSAVGVHPSVPRPPRAPRLAHGPSGGTARATGHPGTPRDFERFWIETIPTLDDAALDLLLGALGFEAMDIRVMGSRAIRVREALSGALRRHGEVEPEALPDFGGLSTTIPEPIAFRPDSFRESLAAHADALRDQHDAIVDHLRESTSGAPHDFVDALAVEITPDELCKVHVERRREVAYRYRIFHGVYRALFLVPPHMHLYIVIRTREAVSLRLAHVVTLSSGQVRLLVEDGSLLVEPTQQTHVVQGEHVRTVSVTPSISERVDMRPLRPEPDAFEVLDRLAALYDPVIRQKWTSSRPHRDEGHGERPVFVSVLSSWFFGESVQVLPWEDHPFSSSEFPAIAAAMTRPAPKGWLAVLLEDAGVGGLRWLRVARDAAEPMPARVNEVRVALRRTRSS